MPDMAFENSRFIGVGFGRYGAGPSWQWPCVPRYDGQPPQALFQEGDDRVEVWDADDLDP